MTRAFFVQLGREMAALLHSPIAYVLFTCMAFISGYNFLNCAEYMSMGMTNITTIQIFFMMPIFWFVMLIFIPVLTMRLMSEEYKTGTIEMLLTAPLMEWDLILAKFFGAVGFYMIVWTPPLLFLACFQVLTNNEVPVAPMPLLLSYTMILLIGMFWISIGLFASSLTKNQIIAGFSSFTVIAGLFFYALYSYNMSDDYKEVIAYIHTLVHMQTFSVGTFDTRPVVFYLSGTLVFLFMTRQVLSVRRLKS